MSDLEISSTERRKLAKFPKFELNSEYITKVDEYLLDHFPLRDEFRSIKAKFNYNILQKLDNNGIYLSGDYIFKSEYPTNKESIEGFKNKISKLTNLLTDNNNIYLVVVPDKNYYIKDSNFLNIDYEYIYNELGKLDYQVIDIRDVMSLEDYYYTDTHWKQEKLDKVIKEVSLKMKFNYENINYKINNYSKFYGIYYGESLNSIPDNICYLTIDVIDNSKVFYLENDKFTGVYNTSKLTGMDSYDVYLDGASSFIEITNDMSDTDRELVIFRDSFGSSISPLFINYYSKITIIDNRYISSNYFTNYINFDSQDVLIMNSTMIINDSFTLKNQLFLVLKNDIFNYRIKQVDTNGLW